MNLLRVFVPLWYMNERGEGDKGRVDGREKVRGDDRRRNEREEWKRRWKV